MASLCQHAPLSSADQPFPHEHSLCMCVLTSPCAICLTIRPKHHHRTPCQVPASWTKKYDLSPQLCFLVHGSKDSAAGSGRSCCCDASRKQKKDAPAQTEIEDCHRYRYDTGLDSSDCHSFFLRNLSWMAVDVHVASQKLRSLFDLPGTALH